MDNLQLMHPVNNKMLLLPYDSCIYFLNRIKFTTSFYPSIIVYFVSDKTELSTYTVRRYKLLLDLDNSHLAPSMSLLNAHHEK